MKKFYLLIGLCIGFIFLCGNVKGQEQQWVQSQKLVGSQVEQQDIFGTSVAISDNYVIIGSPESPTGNGSGKAYIYKKDGINWVEQTILEYPSSFGFGSVVAISDKYAVISSTGQTIFVYEREGENWIFKTTLTEQFSDYYNGFGVSLVLLDDQIFIGSYQSYDSTGNRTGAVYTYKRIDGVWTFHQKLTPQENLCQWFGLKVSANKDWLVVNAPAYYNRVYIYKYINGEWIQHQQILPPNGQSNLPFGSAISSSENRIIISHIHHEASSTSPFLYILELENQNWVIRDTITIEGRINNPFTLPYWKVENTDKYIITSQTLSDVNGLASNNVWSVYEYTNDGWVLKTSISDDTTVITSNDGSIDLTNDFFIVGSPGNNSNGEGSGAAYIYINKEIANVVSGKVHSDNNFNCIQESTENNLSNWLIKADPGDRYAITDSLGKYNIALGEGTYTITQIPPSNQALLLEQQNCPTTPYTITFDSLGVDTTGFDFANSITECSLLKVDVSSNRRRRCFTNQTTVSYCNEGLVSAENVEIKVAFPQYVLPLSSTQAWTSRQDSVYTFTIGTLAPGQCSNFIITDSVACVSGITGAAQCTQASIFPKNNCVQPNEDWNGAALAITGECLILFDPVALVSIKNTGTANMTTASQFRIFSSDTLIYQDQLQLVAGDSLVLEIPTQGQTVRIEVDQVPNYPGGTMISYQTSGDCGSPTTPNAAMASLAMQFPADDEAAEVESECLPIIDSYDPNDKQVHPIGFTENHYVRPGTELEYTIRFQNTGTAEAVNIVVIDTLSADLDMTQFQMMSASHPYKLQVSGKGKPILTWLFNNINLPDSTSNEPASHGFIKFKIKPLATIPEGTIIENFGDIYFDFNEPIRTNTAVSNITNYQFPTALIDFCTMVRKAEAGTNQTLCQTTTTLSGNTPTFGQGTWSVVSGAGTFTDTNSPTSQVNNLAVGDNIFKWRISSAECTATESTVKITRLPFPTQANAGTDKIICEANNTLQGNTPSIGQGKWTLVSGSATILNVNASNSAIQNIAYGENTFRWSIGNGTCDSTHSTVKITRLREPTTANAGQDKNICESNYTLQGNTPQYGQGTWSKVSGSGNLINPNSPNASIENLTVGESIFEWKITNGICVSSQSQVKITRLPAQANSVNIQSTATAICAGETVTFTATATNGGTNPVFQWKINGQNAGTNSATFASNQIQNNDLISLTMQANVACPSPAKANSNEIKMTIYPKPAKPEIQQTKLNLLKSSVSGLNYRWYKDGVLLNNTNKDTLQIDELGTYEVEVLGENCISEKSQALQLNEDALQQFASLRKANIFPNPNAGKFTLKIPNNAGSSVKIELFDSQGKSLFRKEYPSTKLIDFEEEIQTQNLQSGTYLLQIETLQGKETKRIVVR